MVSKISSEVISISKELCVDDILIENELKRRYHDIVRWAIVAVSEGSCKITVSYRTEV